MDWLNYHHLLYFWTVAREGGLSPAARKLRVTHSTVGAQVHALEESLGEKLLVRSGRRLVPTEMGLVVLRYADEIFGLGRELVDTVRGRPTGQPIRVSVGIVDALPKLVARRLLQPAHELAVPVRMVCLEDHLDRLLAELAVHTLDVVLSDSPPTTTGPVRVFGHSLGESEVSFFAEPKLARRLADGFPRSLHGAPVILPAESSALRRSIDAWLVRLRVRPNVVAEVEDSALLKAFGQEGLGAFPAPTVVRDEVVKQYGVRELGVARGVIERFFAITAERRFDHPAVAAITAHARADVFKSKKAKKTKPLRE
ncbi:MAG: LysR family transcriptional regulator [Myxococcota bacterium]|nr:LysR family transcriptional regulator [Myxococcota bacterium]